MTLRLVNEYTSHNLGDATIYETLVQLAGREGASSGLAGVDRQFVRGLLDTASEAGPRAYVSVGGDIFNNARPQLITRRFAQNLLSLAKCPPDRTFLFGQGIPDSCRGLSLQLLALALRRLSSVTVRDEHSAARLRALGVKARLSFDLAFAYQQRESATLAGQALFEASQVDPSRAVLISVRGFDQLYPQDNASFVARVAELAARLRARGHQPAIVVQAQADGADSDMAVLRQLRCVLPDLPALNPFDLAPSHHPVDALMGALAQARAVVAVRYHTAVLRLLAGRSVYSLDYSNKGADLARRLRLPGMALAEFDPARALPDIEATADRTFNAGPIQQHVVESFKASLSAARSGVSLTEQAAAMA
jgi:polysaccharide pyruvyl transferase WcaK-like protein